MLSSFVGNVDVPAAAVLIAICAAIAIGITTFLTIHSSKQEIANKFELAKMAQQAETQIKIEANKSQHEKSLAQIAANREVEIRRIDTGMLDLQAAGHRRDDDVG